jgi:hypothetical protein
VVLSTGLPDVEMPAGSLRGLHLVIKDVSATRAALIGRGVVVSPIEEMKGIKWASFSDPDGNTWVLQEIPPGR